MVWRARLSAAMLTCSFFTLPLTLGAALPARAQTAPSLLAVKAALLFKLPRFAYWPQQQDAPVQLCIWGNHPFGDALQTLAQAPIEGRSVALHYPDNAAQVQICQLLFIPDTPDNRDKLLPTLQALESFPVLTVSDIPQFAQQGGVVELAAHPQDPNKLQIMINQNAAHGQGIKFNAQLLRLATLLP